VRGRIRSVSTYRKRLLAEGWQMCCVAPNVIANPAALPATPEQWIAFTAPGTVAGALRSAGAWSLDGAPRHFDSEEWWFRTRFSTQPDTGATTTVIGFDGLATVADVWLDGQPLLSSDNMFVAHQAGIDTQHTEHELVIRFRPLDAQLAMRRPRPRWKTPMVGNQQLRWLRTTLLGRTPGWSPPAAAIGPWRDVWIEQRASIDVGSVALNARLEGSTGRLDAATTLTALGGESVAGSELILARAGVEHRTALNYDSATRRCSGSLSIDAPALWWPHTHGEPALYAATLRVVLDSGASVDIDLGNVGFRSVQVDTTDDDFAVRINGETIFCRGACWTPLDPVTLSADSDALRKAIELVRGAGMNMLRVGGTMVYESDEFLDLCDSNGILLWQDFMFANMDYPDADVAFVQSVQREASQQLARFAGRPALAVLCGNSEGEQQAAMWGAPRELWSPNLFHEVLRAVAAHACPDVPYWPSSAHGGAFPHQASAGTTSYYGVGAYLRPLDDARRTSLRFATECLAFANVPEDSCLAAMPGGLGVRVHHPQWKARSPRDLGAGWDFDDVRDFYLQHLLGVDPLSLRYANHDRYLELSRIVPGIAMAAAFGEWRSRRSSCNGALIWWLRDLWAGAGWGIIDARGSPKAPYYYLKRSLQPLAVFITDEGVNGASIHIVNETAQPFNGTLQLALYRNGEVPVGSASRVVGIGARRTEEIPALALFENFADLTYAYRFGPMASDLMVAQLKNAAGVRIAQYMYSPSATGPRIADAGLRAVAKIESEHEVVVTLSAQRFAQAVTLTVDGFAADDQYFDLPPQSEHVVRLHRSAAGGKFKGTVKALHSSVVTKIEIAE